MSPTLAAVPTASLLAELQKRIDCNAKKERRTIFIGALPLLHYVAWLFGPVARRRVRVPFGWQEATADMHMHLILMLNRR